MSVQLLLGVVDGLAVAAWPLLAGGGRLTIMHQEVRFDETFRSNLILFFILIFDHGYSLLVNRSGDARVGAGCPVCCRFNGLLVSYI